MYMIFQARGHYEKYALFSIFIADYKENMAVETPDRHQSVTNSISYVIWISLMSISQLISEIYRKSAPKIR